MSTQNTRIILASASPRRYELLSFLALDFEVMVPTVDESLFEREAVDSYVARISKTKCHSILEKFTNEKNLPGSRDVIVIAADTTVYIPDQQVLGKPDSPKHARIMLEALSGRMHLVKTAFSIGDTYTGLENITTEIITTEVYFQKLEEQEITDYLNTDEPYDKAGSYALQGIAGKFISHINGSYTNVIGLPLAELRLALLPFLKRAS